MERCRFCFVEINSKFCKDIFNNEQVNPSIVQIVEMLTNLTIIVTDPYTKLSCLDCFNKLIDSYHCRETILRTYQLLIENDINKKYNNSDGNFELDKHGQSILTDDIAENIRHETDDEETYENNQHLNISMDNETTVNENNSDNNNDDNDDNVIIIITNDVDDSNNQQSDTNSLCTDELLGFISKDVLDVEETCEKIVVENDFNDGNQQICENDHHPNLSIGSNNDEPIFSDNRFSDDKDGDKYFCDIIEDGSSIKEVPSIFDAASNQDQDNLKEHPLSKKSVDINDNKTVNSDNNVENLVINQHDANETHLKSTDLECRKKKKWNPKCDICNKTFRSKSKLSKHLKVHSEKRHHCEICDKRFRRKWHFKKHLLTHTGVKPHQCNICDKKFSTKSYLSIHLNIHTNERPYQCHICDKGFIVKANLKQHLLIHTGEKPYQCHICGKKSPLKASLKLHLLGHNSEESFQCHICGKKFILETNLKRHFLTHNLEESYQCNTCNKKFTRKGTLKQHLLTHTNEKSYQCIICYKKFAMKHQLKRHLLIHSSERS